MPFLKSRLIRSSIAFVKHLSAFAFVIALSACSDSQLSSPTPAKNSPEQEQPVAAEVRIDFPFQHASYLGATVSVLGQVTHPELEELSIYAVMDGVTSYGTVNVDGRFTIPDIKVPTEDGTHKLALTAAINDVVVYAEQLDIKRDPKPVDFSDIALDEEAGELYVIDHVRRSLVSTLLNDSSQFHTLFDARTETDTGLMWPSDLEVDSAREKIYLKEGASEKISLFEVDIATAAVAAKAELEFSQRRQVDDYTSLETVSFGPSKMYFDQARASLLLLLPPAELTPMNSLLESSHHLLSFDVTSNETEILISEETSGSHVLGSLSSDGTVVLVTGVNPAAIRFDRESGGGFSNGYALEDGGQFVSFLKTWPAFNPDTGVIQYSDYRDLWQIELNTAGSGNSFINRKELCSHKQLDLTLGTMVSDSTSGALIASSTNGVRQDRKLVVFDDPGANCSPRTLVDTGVGSGPEFPPFSKFVLNEASGQLATSFREGGIAVDIEQGTRKTLASLTTGEPIRIGNHTAFLIEPTGRYAYAYMHDQQVLRYDLHSGEVVGVSSGTVTPHSYSDTQLVLLNDNRLLAFSSRWVDAQTEWKIFAIDLDNGNRELISDVSEDSSRPIKGAIRMAYDRTVEQVYLADNIGFMRLDINTGKRTEIDSSAPEGLLYNGLNDMDVDETTQELIGVDRDNNILALDLSTGELRFVSRSRRTIAEEEQSDGSNLLHTDPLFESKGLEFIEARGIVVRSSARLAIVNDAYLNALIAVDLETGHRQMLSR